MSALVPYFQGAGVRCTYKMGRKHQNIGCYPSPLTRKMGQKHQNIGLHPSPIGTLDSFTGIEHLINVFFFRTNFADFSWN